MRGRRSGVWLMMCGLLAWYMWGNTPVVENGSVDASPIETAEDPSIAIQLKQTKINKLLETLSSGVDILPTNERCHEMLVVLLLVHDDIYTEHTDSRQDIYDAVYIPSFAENMIEISIPKKKSLLEKLKKYVL